MTKGHEVESESPGIDRASPVEFFFLMQWIEREARAARDAAIGMAVARAFAAVVRGIRLLPSLVRDTHVLRDALLLTRQRARIRTPITIGDNRAAPLPASI